LVVSAKGLRLCLEGGGIAETGGFGRSAELVDEGAADALADVGDYGFAIWLVGSGELEAHSDAGAFGFPDIQNQQPAFLIDADDFGFLQAAGPDIGARLLPQTKLDVKLA
jgi:hypothetical protein